MFNYLLLILVIFIKFPTLPENLTLKTISFHLSSDNLKNNLHLDQSDGNYLEQINCEEYKNNVSLIRKLAEGVVKDVWLAKWGSFGFIAVSFLKNPIYSTDFLHNIYMLRNFTQHHSRFTTKYLGNCNDRILFTKFYKLGPLSNLHILLKNQKYTYLFKSNLNAEHCFQFCINYAKVINYLHNSPIGKRVMCDSNDLAKLMSQFMIDDNLNIVANDLDALPDAENEQIKCGNQLIGNLIAPEQHINSKYDQQIDIYKLPFLCNYLLSLCPRYDLLDLLINELHHRCTNDVPTKRPNSTEIVREYLKINYILFN